MFPRDAGLRIMQPAACRRDLRVAAPPCRRQAAAQAVKRAAIARAAKPQKLLSLPFQLIKIGSFGKNAHGTLGASDADDPQSGSTKVRSTIRRRVKWARPFPRVWKRLGPLAAD